MHDENRTDESNKRIAGGTSHQSNVLQSSFDWLNDTANNLSLISQIRYCRKFEGSDRKIMMMCGRDWWHQSGGTAFQERSEGGAFLYLLVASLSASSLWIMHLGCAQSTDEDIHGE